MNERRNIYEQQAYNRRQTVVVMVMFILFLAFLGYGFDAFVLGNDVLLRWATGDGSGPLRPPFGMLAAMAIASVSSLWSYYRGAQAVLAATQAMQVWGHDEPTRRLENVVEEMAIASGLPKPKIYILPDSDLNAFATGRDPQHAHIAVTRGLLEKLSRDELQAVVAHEMSHIRNLDIRLMTVIAALVGTVALLADWTSRVRWGGSRRSRDSKGSGGIQLALLVIWLVAIVLAPLVSQILAMAVSRRREYLADASGAEMTRNPLALAGALHKIEAAVEPTRVISRGTAHLCIADPLGRKMGLREGFLADLFASHPPMEKRIAALRDMGYQDQKAGA